ncbi:hypothetical protein M569_09500 [Genlisea aurea]|uniref:Pentatricopeptide repeat-containing protein n=1 Tax=Genlisea aurea TaxID=192259 RepID=S8DYZ0_9LAMI|nr:hypothetical protein M569_09500 [Genlisea aurea]
MNSPSPEASSKPRISRFSSAEFGRLIGIASDSRHAAQIHAQLLTRSRISSPVLFNKLLALYSRCGQVLQSLALFSNSDSGTNFDDSAAKNVFTYTSLITQLSRSALPVRALSYFNEMRCRSIFPNHFTFSAILPACGDVDAVVGKQMHSLVLKHGFEPDVFVSSALVGMYSGLADVNCARKVFDEMPERNLVCWNSLLVGLQRNENYPEAISLFSDLLAEVDLSPDQVSFSTVLIAIANSRCSATGRKVHGIAVQHGLDSLPYVMNSLMDMYCKCGILEDAELLFMTMEGDGDAVTWNVMAMGFVENGDFERACTHFRRMIRRGVSPDAVSFSTVLHAAASGASLDQGISIHARVVKYGFGGNSCVSTPLISMYAKCGSFLDAERAFAETGIRSVLTWTAMISAVHRHGRADRVIQVFDDMIRDGVEPDRVTFVSVLSACAHTGNVDLGRHYFDMIGNRYGIEPGIEHFACMVDMLCRAGRLQDAVEFAEEMPVEPDAYVLGALLGCCRDCDDLPTGEIVARKLFRIEPDNPGNYVVLHELYSSRGRVEEAQHVRKLMESNWVNKVAGGSCFL